MDITRRGFLGLLASTALVGCSGAKDSLPPDKKDSRMPTGLSPQEERLVKYFFPMLKRNEDNKKEDNPPAAFPFFHKAGDKVTVGYGVNVQDNRILLGDIAIYYGGAKLSDAEKKTFLDSITAKDNSDLGKYTITAEDAEYLGKKALVAEIRNTARILTGPDGKPFLYDLPFCMQALAVDICYNVGQGKFGNYKKFRAALLARDYDKALSESVVYTNKKTKDTNKRREWSKKRLVNIMRVVQQNASQGKEKIDQLLRQDYDANTSFVRQTMNRHTKFWHESLIAAGELEHIQAIQEKAKKLQQNKVVAPKPAPVVKPAVNKRAVPPQKKIAVPPRAKRSSRGS